MKWRRAFSQVKERYEQFGAQGWLGASYCSDCACSNAYKTLITTLNN